MAEGNGNGSGFTVKEIVIEIRDDVRKLVERVDHIDRHGSIGTKQELTDHETRLRGLERFSARWSGAMALVTAFGALAAAVFAVVHG